MLELACDRICEILYQRRRQTNIPLRTQAFNQEFWNGKADRLLQLFHKIRAAHTLTNLEVYQLALLLKAHINSKDCELYGKYTTKNFLSFKTHFKTEAFKRFNIKLDCYIQGIRPVGLTPNHSLMMSTINLLQHSYQASRDMIKRHSMCASTLLGLISLFLLIEQLRHCEPDPQQTCHCPKL